MLQFLFSPTKQFLYDSGKLLAGGKIYVYLKDTQNLATLYDGETGEGKSNPIVLDANGRASVKADDVNEYRLEIYTPYDTLVYTCNAFYAEGGEGGGTFIVRHDETLSGNGTSQNPLGVINIPLAVDETMTAYTDIVEGVSSLVLGVNGDWFNDTFGSALNDKVDWSSFSACCSAVKGGLDNKLDASAYDLSNYYNKQETNNLFENYYNKQEIDETVNVINELKQDKLTFDYNENSAISAINGSALAGQGSEGSCPWISGAKILADTQTMTDNMIIQVLSSFTLSGNKNHCIAVKGGVYRFPNRWEIASGIAETNYFMPQSSMSGYLPISSFSGYTASIASNLENNWNYTNSAYSLSINNFYNKLDASAFSAWSATYSGNSEVNNYITNNSSFIDDSVNVVQTNSSKWNEIEVYEQNSGTYLTAHQDISNKLDTTAFSTVSGTFLTAHQDLSYISGKIDDKLDTTALENLSGEFYPMTGNPSGFLTEHQSLEDYYKKTETSSKEEISAAIAAIPLGDEEVNNVVHNNSATWNNKLDSTAYHELTAGDNIDIQNYVISGKDWTNKIKEASANAFNEATAQIPDPFDPTYLSGQIDNKLNKSESANFYPMTGNPSGFLTAHQSLEDYYKKTETSSKEELSAMFAQLSADETYTLVPGYNIGISSDNNLKQTTIYYTGTNGDEEVNAVVRQYSANGTWLTESDSGKFYPMTGNPSGFLTQHQSLTNYYTKTETSSKQELSVAFSNAGKTYTGDDPIYVNNETNHIGITGEALSAGPNIDIFASGGYVVISANGGGQGGATYNGISPIDVNNTTHQISAKGVSFGVQEPLFFVQDDNQAVIIGCSAGGTTYTGDAQGALDEVYANSGVWLTAHQSLADYQTTAAMTGYVSVSDYNAATARIAELEQVLQTYSGQWLLPNEGEE